MFAKRDWTMLSLIVLAQVALVICYLGLKPRFFPSHPASGPVEGAKNADASVVVAQKPAATPEMHQAESHADGPGDLLPASYNQLPPTPNDVKAAPPVDAKPPLEMAPPDYHLPLPSGIPPADAAGWYPKGADVFQSDKPALAGPPAPGDGPPKPVTPSIPEVTPSLPPVAPGAITAPEKMDKVEVNKLNPVEVPAIIPPVPPAEHAPKIAMPTPLVPVNAPPPKNLVPVPGPSDPKAPPDAGVLPSAPPSEVIPFPVPPGTVPELPPVGPASPSVIKPISAQGAPALPTHPKFGSTAPAGSTVPPAQVKMVGLSQAIQIPSVIKKQGPPPKVAEGPCPWQFKVEIIDKKTQLTATTDKGAVFVIRCKSLNLSRPGGFVEATGDVEIIGKDLKGSCDSLTITWHEDRLLLQGNAQLKRWAHGELIELQGPQLQFHLSKIQVFGAGSFKTSSNK
jgi:hypothetical protein